MIRRLLSITSVLTLFMILVGAQAIALAMTTAVSELTVRGRLQRTVEPGGWVVVADGNKYLLLNTQGYQKEGWFREGTEVEAIGEAKSDIVTSFMEGTPFEVRSLRPLAQGAPGNQIVGGADSRNLTRVLVAGDSIVQAQPDTAILTIAVVTQGKRALDAQQQNATQSDAVIRTLKSAAGAGAEIKTSGYSLQPQRVYKENQPPTITGYEAHNTVTVTLGDLTKVGAVIDAAALAGANEVSGITFTLRKDRPARDQALAEATREALAKAQVIAQALGGRVVRIVEVQEEGTVRPRPVYQDERMGLMKAQAATPIEVGSLEITSRVQLIAEVEGK